MMNISILILHPTLKHLIVVNKRKIKSHMISVPHHHSFISNLNTPPFNTSSPSIKICFNRKMMTV